MKSHLFYHKVYPLWALEITLWFCWVSCAPVLVMLWYDGCLFCRVFFFSLCYLLRHDWYVQFHWLIDWCFFYDTFIQWKKPLVRSHDSHLTIFVIFVIFPFFMLSWLGVDLVLSLVLICTCIIGKCPLCINIFFLI